MNSSPIGILNRSRLSFMKVSVIIPNYNTAQYLVEAIDSVFASQYKDFEIIVVDDGSKDNSAEVVNPYLSLPNFKFIAQANKGLAGARNTGIQASEGEYLVFLDSDDIVLPQKFTDQVSLLDNHEEIDAVYSTSIFFKDGEPEFKIPTNFPVYSGHILKQLLFGNFIHVNAIMVRREAVVKAGMFDETLRELEDWDLWLRLSLAGSRFSHQEQILSEVRLRKGSMTSNQLKMNKTMARVLEKHIPELRRKYLNDKSVTNAAYTALLIYKLQAEEKAGYLSQVLTILLKQGVSFLSTSTKLAGKFFLSFFISFENKTVKHLEEVWNG